MARYIMAHDLGTSGDKATLFDLEGGLVAERSYRYDTRYLNDNWAEQNPHDWWKAVRETSRALLQGACLSRQC